MKLNLALLLFLVLFSVQSQNYKFGKVTREELKQTFNPKDSSASAAILYKSENISFDYNKGRGFTQIREVHERIKIYNKDGYNWATKKIRLYDGANSKSERLENLKGYTYKLIEGKIEDFKLKKDGIFKEEANKYWKYMSFTMPNINDGCIIEYSYQISSPFLAIDDIELQYTIPINKLDLSVKTPEYFIYNQLVNPRASFLPHIKNSKKNRTESITNKERGTDGILSRTNFSQSNLEMVENVITCNEDYIPALKDEPFVSNINNYRATLKLELTAIKYPSQPYKSLASSWDDVTKTIYDDSDFGKQLDRSSYFKEDIDALLAGITDPTERSFMIFNYIKSKIKWNEYNGYSSDIGVKQAYTDGVGNVADINLMLIAMLRYAGFKANPVLVSTKNNGIPLFPTRQGFNYVICLIEDQGFVSLLDATHKYSANNVLPTRVLNWQGRIIRENGSSEWINLTPLSLSKDITSLNVKINSDLSIDGKVRQQKTDYVAMNYRNKYANINSDEIIASIEKDNGELEVLDINIENKKDSSKPLKLEYDYNLADGIEDIGGNLYFSPMLFFASEENPFKQETRNFSIDLMYPFSEKYLINIMIPEGYAVESIPKNEKLQFNDAGDFTYLAKQNGSFLQLTVSLNMKTSSILAKDYQVFKSFYSRAIEKQTEKIVLKKI